MSGFGFGSNNNQQSGFGGFGSTNTGGGFGTNNNTSTSGSLFGGNTATSGGFGTGGGFGAPAANNSPFGGAAKPAFGASTTTAGGSLFGASNTATTGGFGSNGGGFGTQNAGGGFGGSTGGGLFGQNRPATGGFGSTNTNTGGSLFGGGSTTTGGFGATNNNTSSPFGTNANTTSNFGAANTGGGFGGFGSSSAAQPASNNGTANPPFVAQTEKEQNTNNIQQFQSITFQQPYTNKCFEELRTEDYAQGRRFGNSNGQAGGFGQSTGFGGTTTTTTGGGLFGNNNNAAGTTGFGSTGTGFGAANTGGFGSNAGGGGLFGAPKPATGGSIFGGQSTATNTGGFGATSGSGGGLFGGGGTGGFGSNTNNTNTGGGLFGANNQQQNKPAFGGFGSTTNTGGGFGTNNTTNTGGGLFGSSTNNNTGGGIFGQNNQQQQPQQQQQQQQQPSLFGGTNTNTGGGLFGAQQNKPVGGGLFGNNASTNTGGGLFGAQNNQQQSTGFGQTTNTGGGLFGNQNQNKPAGSGLFGSSTNTGGGLFGNQNNQQQGTSLFGGGNNSNNAGSSMFGNQNKPAGSGLFGSSTNQGNNTTSLFGNNQQNQQGNAGSSLFGGLNQNNQNQQSMNNNSLFGGSFGGGQPAQQNQLHASLTGAPYGNEQLFSSLAAPSPPVGPLATPLSGARPTPKKTPSLLASARVNTPVYSPRGGAIGRGSAYGFSYSTYGTPGSAFTSGSLTPGASSLLRPTGSLSSALTSRLSKSFSTSNLRGDAMASEGRSLLRPSAFSPDGPSKYGSGSVRKLKIDRGLRTDLFAPEPKPIESGKEGDAPGLRKRVSFDNREDKTPEASASNALVRTESEDDSESPGLIRNGPSKAPAPSSKKPEMEQANGSTSALSTVPEDGEAPRPSSAPASKTATEKTKRSSDIGDYWTKPAMKDLRNMSRQQLKNVGNFVVGRDGVGRIEFQSKGSVDLTNTQLEDICGTIVQLNPRSATVYQDDKDKPSMGKALNVPSTIYLENSWPRAQGGKKAVSAKSGQAYDKHVARLKRVGGTQFLSYDPDTGIWSFKVDHFTTYGLDDEDDDESEFFDESQMQDTESSALSDAPETPTGQQDMTLQSMDTGAEEPDDTFQFKFDRRSQRSIPGGFGSEGVTFDHDDQSGDEAMEEDEHMMSGALNGEDPFTSPGGPVQAPSPGAVERYHSSMVEDEEDEVDQLEQEIPGSFIEEPKMPRSILKPSTAFTAFISPEKFATESWEEQLQRTMSPRKRDRQALRDMQQTFMRVQEDDVIESPFKQSMLGQSALGQSYLAQKSAKKQKVNNVAAERVNLGKSQAFNTSMDIMQSLWSQSTTGGKATGGAKGFEIPHPKKPRLSDSSDMHPQDSEWHDSFKPTFAPNGTLVYSVSGSAPQVSEELLTVMAPLIAEHKDVRFAKVAPAKDINPMTLLAQKELTTIDISSGFPVAHAPSDISFESLAENVDPVLAIATQEKAIWQLCSVLFDPLSIACARFVQGIPDEQVEQFASRMRMDALSEFWSTHIVALSVKEGLKRARTAEEKALLYLTQNDIVAACDTLVAAKDFKLAMLVSQLPGTEQSRAMMKTQIDAWRARNDWAEMSDAVRALYSILAGLLCVVEGKAGAVENRTETIVIAEKFGLTWQQSFALRLHYGGYQNIEETIQAYQADVLSGRERVQPIVRLPNGTGTDDTLMGLLRLFPGSTDKTMVFDERSISGNALNSRLTWQLISLLRAKGLCDVTDNTCNSITYNYATELENAGKFVSGTWTLLHLPDRPARQKAIAGLLERHSDIISTPGQDERGTFEDLTQDNQIPSSLVWRAKATYAKGGMRDPALQAEWLLRAGDVEAAHGVLRSAVGPQAVIEQDYATLSNLLHHFHGRRIEGWEAGGQVYADFLRIVRAQGGRKQSRDVEPALHRLPKGLEAMEHEGGSEKSIEERVAIIEMRKVLVEASRDHGQGENNEGTGGMDTAGFRGMEHDLLRRYQQAMGVVA